MARYKNYSEEFKKALIKKVVLNPEGSVNAIARDAGVPSSTLGNWVRRAQIKGSGLAEKKQDKWSPEDKLNAVIKTASMNEAEKSEYCREQGIYTSDIERWRSDCLAGCTDKKTEKLNKKERAEVRRLEKETKRLQKELKRKDKALAETAALLVLKKKAQALWGDDEEDI
jgi:transposase-like protein